MISQETTTLTSQLLGSAHSHSRTRQIRRAYPNSLKAEPVLDTIWSGMDSPSSGGLIISRVQRGFSFHPPMVTSRVRRTTTVSDGHFDKMIAILQADCMVAIPVLICATASLLLMLWSRQKRRIVQSASNPLRTRRYSGWKVSGRHISSKLTIEHSSDKQHSGNSKGLDFKRAVIMLLTVTCALLFWRQSVLASILNEHRTIEHSPESAFESTLQEVFQVYQPISSASDGLAGCDLDVLLMDHVFGQSYGKPFVGTRRAMR